MANGRGSTNLEKAENRLKSLENLVDNVEDASDGYFHRLGSVEPYPDVEFGDDNILAHEGTVIVKPKKGTIIELVPIS